MSKDYSKIMRVGDSRMLRIPFRVIRSKDYPFEVDLEKIKKQELVVEIVKVKGVKGLFVKEAGK